MVKLRTEKRNRLKFMYQALFDPQYHHHVWRHSYLTENTLRLHYQEKQVRSFLQSTSLAVCYESRKKQKADVSRHRSPSSCDVSLNEKRVTSKPVRLARYPETRSGL